MKEEKMSDAICRERVVVCEDVRVDQNSILVHPLKIVMNVMGKWAERRKLRRNYYYLAGMDDHVLRDIGLDRGTLRQTVLERGRTP